MSLIIVFFFIGVVSTMGEITDFFPEAKNNLTKISWAHAVNNQALLEDALKGSVMMLEADIVMGKLINTSSEDIPIMAHPPNNTSDLSLEEFLKKINDHNNATGGVKKGVKLDFKTIEVFEKSINLLNQLYPNIRYPFWLNADILPGPVNATTIPVDAQKFLNLAKNFPNATLSIGWTTNYDKNNNATSSYTDEQINEMIKTIQENNVNQTVTFPVRAVFAAESLETIKSLLTKISNSTLTIWSSEGDNVNVTNLRTLIKTAGLDKVYIDVPQDLEKQLHLDTISSSAVKPFLNVFIAIFAVLITKVIL